MRVTKRPCADRFDTLMRFNTVLIKYNTCCHDFFTHRLQPELHYVVSCLHGRNCRKLLPHKTAWHTQCRSSNRRETLNEARSTQGVRHDLADLEPAVRTALANWSVASRQIQAMINTTQAFAAETFTAPKVHVLTASHHPQW